MSNLKDGEVTRRESGYFACTDESGQNLSGPWFTHHAAEAAGRREFDLAHKLERIGKVMFGQIDNHGDALEYLYLQQQLELRKSGGPTPRSAMILVFERHRLNWSTEVHSEIVRLALVNNWAANVDDQE